MSHCKNCLFPVTQTKLGPCLIFKWRSEEHFKTINVTIDLIPVLPIAGSSTCDLFESVTNSLLDSKPPNWLSHISRVLNQDKILPEAFEDDFKTVPINALNVAIKLINYGNEHNYIIQPAQHLDVTDFDDKWDLKQCYCMIKALKFYLDIDVSSYLIKKILLSKEFKGKKERVTSIEKVVYEAFCHPELKKEFSKFIDFEKWTGDNLEVTLRRRDTFQQ